MLNSFIYFECNFECPNLKGYFTKSPHIQFHKLLMERCVKPIQEKCNLEAIQLMYIMTKQFMTFYDKNPEYVTFWKPTCVLHKDSS